MEQVFEQLLPRLQEIWKHDVVQALFIAGVIALASAVFGSRGRLIWAVSHGHNYKIEDAESDQHWVSTRQLWVQNSGRKIVNQIEIVLNFRPQNFNVWPPRDFEQSDIPDGRFALKFDGLAKGEYFTISMLVVNSEIPNVANVRWSNGIATEVPMGPQQIFPTWVTRLAQGLTLLGLFTLIYLAVVVLT